ncbi:MAG: hypothetical protein ACKVII_06705 [Planctomycetales bacterium]
MVRSTLCIAIGILCFVASGQSAFGQIEELSWPPQLPGGQSAVSIKSADLLKPQPGLSADVRIAKTAPEVDLLYYPEQNYPGHPWSVWGDGLTVGTKYYSAIGDHLAPQGDAFVVEYDSETSRIRTLASMAKTINLPDGHYMPGKIHSRIDLGSDGWLYYATHRGSTRVTTDEYHYKGDWILRTHPESGKTEVVVQGPVSKACIPTSVLDPDRMIFYGGTSAGDRTDKTVTFFAYDIARGKVLHTATGGPARYLILARSTGRVYYMKDVTGKLMRYDPTSGNPPQAIAGTIGLRAATQETPDGMVYTVGKSDGHLWQFNTKTEAITDLCELAVASQTYTTTIDADPSGRYLYYIPGAHGGSQKDGTPIIQFDTRQRTKKVIAFLQPLLQKQYGYVTLGTFGAAVSPDGSRLFITWNGNRSGADKRGRYPFDTCALTVIYIPESERRID